MKTKRLLAAMALVLMASLANVVAAAERVAQSFYVATEGDKTVHSLVQRWATAAGVDLRWMAEIDYPLLSVEMLNERAHLADAKDLRDAVSRVFKMFRDAEDVEPQHILFVCPNQGGAALQPLVVRRAGQGACPDAEAIAGDDIDLEEAAQLYEELKQVDKDLQKMKAPKRGVGI